MGMVLNLSEPSLDMYLYGSKAHILNNYLANQMAQIQPAFNAFSQRIHDSIASSYNFINDKLTQYGLLNQLQNQGLQALDNYYVDITSFQGLQTANLTMQRWVMAHPVVRQLYLSQNIDGYSNSYQNVFGKEVGEQDYNYRRVMDGVVVDTEDGFVVKHYIDDLMPGDRELDHREKTKILTTYDFIDHLLDTCKFDFTCSGEEPPKINR